MFLKYHRFALKLLIISFFYPKNSYPNYDSEKKNSFFDYGVKITLRNINYLPSTRSGNLNLGIIDPSTPENPSVDMDIWYMDLPRIGSVNQYCYSGSNNCKLIAYFDTGKVLLPLKDFNGVVSDSIKHIFIVLQARNTYKSQFPLVNIRYIDNKGSVESLKFLAAKAVRKYRNTKKITEEEVKSKLPQDLQEYLQERENLNDFSNIVF